MQEAMKMQHVESKGVSPPHGAVATVLSGGYIANNHHGIYGSIRLSDCLVLPSDHEFPLLNNWSSKVPTLPPILAASLHAIATNKPTVCIPKTRGGQSRCRSNMPKKAARGCMGTYTQNTLLTVQARPLEGR